MKLEQFKDYVPYATLPKGLIVGRRSWFNWNQGKWHGTDCTLRAIFECLGAFKKVKLDRKTLDRLADEYFGLCFNRKSGRIEPCGETLSEMLNRFGLKLKCRNFNDRMFDNGMTYVGLLKKMHEKKLFKREKIWIFVVENPIWGHATVVNGTQLVDVMAHVDWNKLAYSSVLLVFEVVRKK